VVIENEQKSPSVGVLIIRRGTDGEAKTNFRNSFPNAKQTTGPCRTNKYLSKKVDIK
jgi:hypothetical protein